MNLFAKVVAYLVLGGAASTVSGDLAAGIGLVAVVHIIYGEAGK